MQYILWQDCSTIRFSAEVWRCFSEVAGFRGFSALPQQSPAPPPYHPAPPFVGGQFTLLLNVILPLRVVAKTLCGSTCVRAHCRVISLLCNGMTRTPPSPAAPSRNSYFPNLLLLACAHPQLRLETGLKRKNSGRKSLVICFVSR